MAVHILQRETIKQMESYQPSSECAAFLTRLRKTPKWAAIQVINEAFPLLTVDAVDDLIMTCPDAQGAGATEVKIPWGRFHGIAWLAGATWAQIAAIRCVTPQSVRSTGAKFVHGQTKPAPISLAKVRALHDAFIELCHKDYRMAMFGDLTQIAGILHEMEDRDVAAVADAPNFDTDDF